MSPCIVDKIQAMFDLYDKIEEAIWTPLDQISDKQHKILKQLDELIEFKEKKQKE